MLRLDPSGPIRLRPEAGEDGAFVRAVYSSTREDELAILGWSERQKQQFLEMQFRAQSAYYRAQFPNASFLIIEERGLPVGRLYLHEGEDEIRVIDIALLPEHRRKGIGGNLLGQILAQGRARGKAVQIHVERFNPALRLYERLGFRVMADEGVYWRMEWAPAKGGGASKLLARPTEVVTGRSGDECPTGSDVEVRERGSAVLCNRDENS